MQYTSTRNTANRIFLFIAIFASGLAAAVSALACDETKYRSRIVTYYELDERRDGYGDTRCFYYTGSAGNLRCKIRLRGTLYYPLASAYNATSKFPAILANHGSEETFEANTKFCTQAEYFVPKGYIVFAPFRRGQGDDDVGEGNQSSGAYVEDLLDDFQNGTGNYVHSTTCTNRSCYKAELLKEQADEEIKYAMDWMKARSDVKTDPGEPNDHRIAIMGISYGGAVTVFANRAELGQKVAVAFSPGAQQWDPSINCHPGEAGCGTDFQRSLIDAAAGAEHAAFYLQARWDYDTRATIDLAYAHAYGTIDSQHSRPWMASIFAYKNPCNDDGNPACSDDEFQSIHSGFWNATNVWGTAVKNFMKRHDVE